MTVIYIIGALLCILDIFLFKYSRSYYTGEPVMKMWCLLALIVLTMIPGVNFIVGIVCTMVWILGISTYEWKTTKCNKLINFLNKPIG